MRFCCYRHQRPRSKFLCRWLLFSLLLVSTGVFAQHVTLAVKEARLEAVFELIKKQTGYSFLYTSEEIKNAKPVTISLENATVPQTLNAVFNGQPLLYNLDGTYVVVQPKPEEKRQTNYEINGQVVDEKGEGIGGASVRIANGKAGTAADERGMFTLNADAKQVILIISSIGFETKQVPAGTGRAMRIVLMPAVNKLDEQVVIAYGTTTRRLSTGVVSKVGSSDIEKQPVSNPLAALQGRVPGLQITQNNGLPGSSFTVLIRGRNSLQQGTSPLFIIDGTPFLSDVLSQRSGGLGNNNPFKTLNPLDIESIEVLRDADATAIYGSRGANGVILITTKKNKSNQTTVDVSVQQAFSRITRAPDYLNTADYVQMRREAFKNDGVVPTAANAPDLLVWDTTRYTNWKNKLIGGTANTTTAQINLSGGSLQTKFSLNGNFYKVGTVFPGDFGETRKSVQLNVSHASADHKFNLILSTNYGFEDDDLTPSDPTSRINTAPNAPNPFDADGRLVWAEGGVSFSNPFALLYQHYVSNTTRLTTHADMSYSFAKHFKAKLGSGFNDVQLTEELTFPIGAADPSTNPKGSASFATTSNRIWTLEPQLEYNAGLGRAGRMDALVGNTWQQTTAQSTTTDASGYINDDLLHSTAGASAVQSTKTASMYRYTGLFARVNYNYQAKYILNLTWRRDGSTRFGTAHQFSNFYALGTAWVFTEDKKIKKALPVISYGKVKLSWGITGNDQIGNYQYLDNWGNTVYAYAGLPGLRPVRLYNPNYTWEQNRKIDLSLDLGLFQNRVYFNAVLYRSRSDNQIITYTLPSQTGFNGVLENFPGIVQNAGIELELQTTNIKAKNFSWNTSINLTVNRNQLQSFPGLSASSYANTYTIGQSLNSVRGYHYLGVDPSTGVYQFADLNKDGAINTQDYQVIGTTDPVYYGGFQNSIAFQNFSVDFLFQFVRARGKHVVYSLPNTPGSKLNYPVDVFDRWQQAGDVGPYERFSQSSASAATTAMRNMINSDARFTDASYIRLKNISFSYRLAAAWLQKMHVTASKIFLLGQNLLTLTHYKGLDPESQNQTSLPPLKTVSVGFQLTF